MQLHKSSFFLITDIPVGLDETLVHTGSVRNTCNMPTPIGTENTFLFQRDQYMPSVAKVGFVN